MKSLRILWIAFSDREIFINGRKNDAVKLDTKEVNEIVMH